MTAGAPQANGAESAGAEILAQLAGMIRRYIALTSAQADVLALWIVHTHAIDAALSTPYLAVTSAVKQCGKTRLLELLELLVREPWLTGSVSVAVLFHTIDESHPTLLFDESDAAFNGKEYGEALRAVLDSGHRRGGHASRCVQKGKDFERRDYETFCPKAIAGIGNLPDTVNDRSIPIRLKRKLRGQEVARFRRREVEPQANELRERVSALATGWNDALADAKPALPDVLSDRQQDGAEPLLAIADAAGGEWPERAREALVKLLTGNDAEDQSVPVRLLADIRSVFTAKGRDKLSSDELVTALNQDETLPWGEYDRGKPLSQIGLAKRLKPFGIYPHSIRLDKGTPKGYELVDFEDAWASYLPPPTPQAATPPQPASLLDETAFSSRNTLPSVAVAKSGSNPHEQRIVAGVAFQNGGKGDSGEIQAPGREPAGSPPGVPTERAPLPLAGTDGEKPVPKINPLPPALARYLEGEI